MRYLLVGNYGVGNAGDEILKEYFLERFPEHEWFVCSAKPGEGELARLPAGIRSFLSLKWLRTLRMLKASDGVVFGGGSLCTDSESLLASWVWFVHAWFAVILRKPLFLAFQGIGPFRTFFGEWCARFAVRHAVFISVRDTASAERLSGDAACTERDPRAQRGGRVEACPEPARGAWCGVWKKNTEVVQTFDPSILLLKETIDQVRSKNVFMVIPRFSTVWKRRRNREHVRRALRVLCEHGMAVRILSLQPHHQREHDLCFALAEPIGLHVEPAPTIHHALALLTGGTCMVTQRYHGAIAAIAAGIPFVALRLQEGDKLDAIARMCSCPSKTPQTLEAAFLMETDWERMREGMVSLREQYRKLVVQGEEALRGKLNMEN